MINTDYTVEMQGENIDFILEDYEPGSLGNRTGHPDTWTEGESATLDFSANSDSELLNNYINNDMEIREYIQRALLKLILKDIKNSNDELQSEMNYENK